MNAGVHGAGARRKGGERRPSERATLVIVLVVLLLSVGWLLFATGVVGPGPHKPSPADIQAAQRKASDEEKARQDHPDHPRPAPSTS